VPAMLTTEYVINKKYLNVGYGLLKEMNMAKENEQVLVFPDAIFEKLGKFSGVSKEGQSFLKNPLFLDSLSYRLRSEMEVDESYKQLIPYCVLTVGDSEKKFFVYQRAKKGGEKRLHDKYSIGVGGHINPVDGEPASAYDQAFHRELAEEVSLSGNFGSKIIGAIYDDSEPVGRVHFGVVHLLSGIGEVAFEFNDEALDDMQFQSYSWLKENVDKFENWSKLVINGLLSEYFEEQT
jgi:predicted NUDIX family phosphoesterase